MKEEEAIMLLKQVMKNNDIKITKTAVGVIRSREAKEEERTR